MTEITREIARSEIADCITSAIARFTTDAVRLLPPVGFMLDCPTYTRRTAPPTDLQRRLDAIARGQGNYAREHQLRGWVFTGQDLEPLWAYFRGGRCWFCDDVATTLDHGIGVSAYGPHVVSWEMVDGHVVYTGSLFPACGPCNSRHHKFLPEEWTRIAYGMSLADALRFVDEHGIAALEAIRLPRMAARADAMNERWHAENHDRLAAENREWWHSLTPEEKLAISRAKPRKTRRASMSAVELEAVRAADRVDNLNPASVDRRRARQRVDGMTEAERLDRNAKARAQKAAARASMSAAEYEALLLKGHEQYERKRARTGKTGPVRAIQRRPSRVLMAKRGTETAAETRDQRDVVP